tara:strand:+ start:6215 stop:6748 length:534 start_codon:yes stop_codon:yes gene_type:complete
MPPARKKTRMDIGPTRMCDDAVESDMGLLLSHEDKYTKEDTEEVVDSDGEDGDVWSGSDLSDDEAEKARLKQGNVFAKTYKNDWEQLGHYLGMGVRFTIKEYPDWYAIIPGQVKKNYFLYKSSMLKRNHFIFDENACEWRRPRGGQHPDIDVETGRPSNWAPMRNIEKDPFAMSDEE